MEKNLKISEILHTEISIRSAKLKMKKKDYLEVLVLNSLKLTDDEVLKISKIIKNSGLEGVNTSGEFEQVLTRLSQL